MAIELRTPTITEMLTWQQICEAYPEQWVCLVEIEYVEGGYSGEIRCAKVVGHGHRKEPFEQAKPWRDHYWTIGHYYTGELQVPDIRYHTRFHVIAFEPL